MMQPGRELDALIAEKVMGWVVDGDGEIFHNGLYLMDLNQWRPSTDIRQAWKVVERIMLLGTPIEIECIDYEFRVRMVGAFGFKKDISAPIAICRFAIELFGLEKAA